MMKKLFAMLMVLVLCLGMVSSMVMTASAATIEGQCGTSATYTLTDDGVLTVSGTGAIERNAFGSSAKNNATLNKGFTDYLKIQKVVINEGITEISYQAFINCSSITSVDLPSTITKIQDNAFFQCTNLKSINLPEGLTYIGTNAFYGCKNLTEITLPSTLTYLGNAAFHSCTSLKTVILSEGMTATIPQYAFRGAILTDITIPASVKKLDQYAFWAASNLKNVTIKNNDITLGNQSFSASAIVFTVPCNFDQTKITAAVVNNNSFTFSSDYLHIDANNDGVCDGGCSTATVASVSLNKNSITLTSAGATETLTATITPDSVTADLTWRSDNSAVATVNNGVVTAVGEGIATITVEAGGKTAKCTVTVSLPQNPVTGVSLSQTALTLAVDDTYELDAVISPTNADNKNVTWSSNANDIATVDNDGVVTALATGSATITVTTQDGGKTATCSITVVNSHEHTWDSYTGACGGCSLTHYTHGTYEWNNGNCSVCGVAGGYCGYVGTETSVEYILTSTDTGNTYTLTISGYGSMGEYIDYNDSSNPPWYDYRTKITSVIIQNGVNDIGWGAFKYHTALQNVSIPNSVTEIKRAAFIGASSLTSITLPSSITKIGQAVFKESGLTSISIPSGVTQIQGSTFSGCTKLATVTLPNSITEIEGNAFQQCSSLSQITLPTGLTTVGEWAFNQSGLTSVTIPSSVTSLGMHAFSGCPNLQTVMINGTDLTIADRAFQGDEALEALTIKNTGNVSIGDYAFMIEVAEDDDEVDIGDVGIGGWTPADDDQIETQSSINSRSTVKYTSQSETGEIGKDKLYTITLPDNVTYTTDYATSFKNRVRAVNIGDTATVLVGNSIKASPAFTSDTAFDETLTWSTSNPEVATVDAYGKVTGVSAGSATITATSKYKLNGVFRADYCVITVKQHTHEWIYSVNVAKDTITATCSNTDNNCPNADGGSVNIALPDSVEYTGSAIEAKVTDNMIPEHTVVYSGDGLVAGKPVIPGSYRASITVDTDKTASVEYTIDQATLTVYGTGIASGTYGAKLSELTISGLTATLNGNEVYGTWTLTSEDVPNVGDTGSYTVTFTPAAHAEYYKPLTAQVTLNIDPAQHAAPTAVEGSYEPNANRTAFVYTVSKPSGIAYEYSTNGADWQDSPIFDGFNAGDKATFYARVKEDSNHTASEPVQSAEVTFEKLDQAAPALSYQVSGHSGNRTITIAEMAGSEYSFDGGNTWDSSNVKNGINDETVSIAIRMKETAVYKASEKVSASVNTARQVQTVTFDTTDRTATYGDGTLEGRAASAEGAITYESSDTAVATVDDKGVVTIVGAGTATITAKAAETETHAAAQASYSLTVNPKALTAEDITLTLTESLYQYDGTAKTPVVLLKDGNTVLEADKDYQVKDGSTTTASAIAVYTITLTGKGNYTGDISEEWEITKIAAPAAPQNLQGVAPTTGLVNDGKIIGTTDEMEYATKVDFSDAKDCGEGETTNLAPGTYYVRLKGTDTTEPGAAAVVNVPAYSAPIITFDANGGTVVIASVTTEQDGTLAELPTATRSGYTFDGWFTAMTGGSQVTVDTFFSVNTTIYAQWTYIPVPPVIDSPAADTIVEVYEGQTAQMTVVSQNATSYQWFINRNDGAGFVEYDGSTLATHTTAAVKPENDGFRYYCLVTNADGSVRSHVFTLKVLEQIDLPQTGDNSHIGVWMAMCLLSMAGILLLRKKPCSR